MHKSTLSIWLIIFALISACNHSPEKSTQVKANIENTLSTTWNFKDPAASRQAFELLLEQNDAPAEQAEIWSQIARTYSLSGEYENAQVALSNAKELLPDSGGERAHVRILLEAGRTYNSSGEKEMASMQFEQALSAAKASQLDFYAIDAAHMLGISNPLEEQIQWHQMAMTMAEQSEEERCKKWLGPLYNNLSWTMHDLERFDEALELQYKSRDFRLSNDDSRGAQIARYGIGVMLRKLNRDEEARQVLTELYNELKAANIEDGYVAEELGELYHKADEQFMARNFFKEAYSILSKDQWMMDNMADRMARIKQLSE